jgi:hypothetical protein|tara:strand:+ start:1182 stop:1484 length:303 start_codon:yes stop_codon:yes gene_type:complete
MIKKIVLLNDTDWKNLHGNEIYVSMLRNKIKCDVDKENNESNLKMDLVEYLESVPIGFVYYTSENIYGYLKYEVYFESPLDMENFFHFYNTTYGLNEIQK